MLEFVLGSRYVSMSKTEKIPDFMKSAFWREKQLVNKQGKVRQ